MPSQDEPKMENFQLDQSGEETDKQSFNDRDQLARLGKKAVLRVRFSESISFWFY